MRGPNDLDSLIAHAWIEHMDAFWAWEELNNMDILERWRMIKVMVDCAPDYGTLAYIAAGPVEDLMMNESAKKWMRTEAEVNRRFRICLQGAYGLADDFQRLVDAESPMERLPNAADIEINAKEATLMVAWFHHHDTSWAITLLEEKMQQQPDEAMRVLELLLKLSDEMPHVREDVFLHAFEKFLRLNFATHRRSMLKMVAHHRSLQQWLLDRKIAPTEDSQDWASFLREIMSV